MDKFFGIIAMGLLIVGLVKTILLAFRPAKGAAYYRNSLLVFVWKVGKDVVFTFVPWAASALLIAWLASRI